MMLRVKVWRQDGREQKGRFEEYVLEDADPLMSILEMLDALNASLVKRNIAPIAFDSDCREGICGACALMVNGRPNGFAQNLPACHQRLGELEEGTRITIEPLRSGLYPVIRDLVVDRSILDRLMGAGGAASTKTGAAPDADGLPIGKDTAVEALDLGACIGCGVCVAACPNGSAALYAGARLASLALLPIPSKERRKRALDMSKALESFFGGCSGYAECVRACPAKIPLGVTGVVTRERWSALFHRKN